MFAALEDVVTSVDGPDTWDLLLDHVGSDGAFTSLGSYDDVTFVGLLVALAELRQVPVDDTIRWFGQALFPWLLERYPTFGEGHSSVRTFLPTINHVIHPEVRKLYPGAEVADFESDTDPSGAVLLTYRSARQLCVLAEGLVAGAGTYFGEVVSVTQPTCTHRGAASCLLVVAVDAVDPAS